MLIRIAIFLFALVASALLLPAVAHAQEAAGSIAGRIIVEGDTEQDLRSIILEHVAVIRAEAQQPLDTFLLFDVPTGYHVEADDEGNFTFAPLADGEYFLMVLPPDYGLPGFEPVIPLPEQVSVLTQEGVVASSALRVKINKGEAVTGFELIVRPAVVPLTLPPPAQAPVPRTTRSTASRRGWPWRRRCCSPAAWRCGRGAAVACRRSGARSIP